MISVEFPSSLQFSLEQALCNISLLKTSTKDTDFIYIVQKEV